MPVDPKNRPVPPKKTPPIFKGSVATHFSIDEVGRTTQIVPSDHSNFLSVDIELSPEVREEFKKAMERGQVSIPVLEPTTWQYSFEPKTDPGPGWGSADSNPIGDLQEWMRRLSGLPSRLSPIEMGLQALHDRFGPEVEPDDWSVDRLMAEIATMMSEKSSYANNWRHGFTHFNDDEDTFGAEWSSWVAHGRQTAIVLQRVLREAAYFQEGIG